MPPEKHRRNTEMPSRQRDGIFLRCPPDSAQSRRIHKQKRAVFLRRTKGERLLMTALVKPGKSRRKNRIREGSVAADVIMYAISVFVIFITLYPMYYILIISLSAPEVAIRESYQNGVTDEFVEPVVCDKEGTISDNDAIIFFNYRPDRAREITRAFVDPAFDGFQREYFPVTYVCNTEYDATMPNVLVAFPRITIHNGLGEYLSKLGLTQLRIAETEKYAHVTFFFNGGVEAPYPGEDRVLVASPKVATYDLQPEMSAYEVTEKCVERIESGAYDVIILNFANCDMVGHTGNYDAAVKAVETVDECVGRVVDATLKMGGIAMITADHGNAEQMLQSDGVSPMTAHTTNPVPFILCGAGNELREGRLADIAPTILDVMGLEKPEEMDGQSLILR